MMIDRWEARSSRRLKIPCPFWPLHEEFGFGLLGGIVRFDPAEVILFVILHITASPQCSALHLKVSLYLESRQVSMYPFHQLSHSFAQHQSPHPSVIQTTTHACAPHPTTPMWPCSTTQEPIIPSSPTSTPVENPSLCAHHIPILSFHTKQHSSIMQFSGVILRFPRSGRTLYVTCLPQAARWSVRRDSGIRLARYLEASCLGRGAIG